MSSKGLTLIEIMISVLIILIISTGVLSAFVGGHQLMNRSRHRLQALNFAREALDKLRGNYKYGSTQMSPLPPDNPHLESEIGGNIIRGEIETLNEAILTYNVTEPEPTGYKKVKVKIEWTEAAF